MKIVNFENGVRQLPDTDSFVPMETIRQRVANIKRSWTPETARSRAVEGKRRQAELESLLEELIAETASDQVLVQHQPAATSFSLVG